MAQWMIKEESSNRLVLAKGPFWWQKKIQIDVDVNLDLVSLKSNLWGERLSLGTTRLSYSGIENIELHEDRYECIVYIKRLEGTLFHPPKEYPEWISKLHIFVCKDFDRNKMSEVAEILVRFLKKSVSVT